MNMKFVVVSEARADFIIATELADRVLVAEIEWLEQELLDSQRDWIGEDSPGNQLAWTTISHSARELGIRAQGHFNGEPGLPDAHAARRAIRYVLKRFDPVDAILLIRDMDDQDERREGLEQARREHEEARREDSPVKKIIIGVAKSERECWVVSGFIPETEIEEQLLQKETQRLGMNPCLNSHELTACKREQELRSPKRVLKVLAGNDSEREKKCWRVTALAVLTERGPENGLADYLKEITVRLVPLISGYKKEMEKQ
jgi:hypothetical protein